MKEFCKDLNKQSRLNKSIIATLVMSTFTTNGIASQAEANVGNFQENHNGIANNKIKEFETIKSFIHVKFHNNLQGGFDFSVSPDKSEITLEMDDTDNSFKIINTIDNDPLVANVKTKVINDKARIVIATKSPVKFKFLKQDKKGLIVLEENSVFLNEDTGEKINPIKQKVKLTGVSNNWSQISTSNTVKEKSLPSIAYNNIVSAEITNINLKKSAFRTSRLTVDLSNKASIPTIKKDGNKLVIDFVDVSIPSELQRRVNTESLGTLTTILDVSSQKNVARLVLEQRDSWDYSFYQIEEKFFVEIKPTEKQEDTEKKYIGKNLSISFQDMEVRAILQVIADFTGLNIMSSDKVMGSMTIRLKDVPWDQALDLILESRGLQKVKDGNVIWIATSEEVAANNRAKLELKLQNTELEPLKLEFFQINYYKAEELKKVLEGKSEGNSNGSNGGIALLSKRGTIGVDPRNNILFIQETETKLKELRKLIKKLDVANKQVLVEAKIVIADSDFGRELGSRFGIRYRRQNGNGAIGIGGNIIESGNQAGTPITVSPLTNFGATGNGAGAIGLTLLNLATGNALGVELSALESTNRGKVLSTPRLLTADNKQATIEQGTEIPYVTPGTQGSPPTVSFKKAVLKLDVTPQIAPNGKVVLDLNIRKDSIGQLVNVQGGGQVPSIDTKNINTSVTVNNGQTVVLGGVYEIENRDDLSKIPLFGDIPLIGNLFKHTNKSETKGELMIFITPYIIEEEDLDDNEPENVSPEINLSKNQ